jgi:hypothetical protein
LQTAFAPVAIFEAGKYDSITANRNLTGRCTCIGISQITVIAFLPTIDDPVAALHKALTVASVATVQVTIITLLT